MRRLAWIALAALAVIPYLPAIHAPLLYDDRTLLDNRWLAREAGPVSVFQHDYWYGTKHGRSDLYRPLAILSLAWNLRASPTKESIRAANVGLHAVATLAVAWMLLALAGDRLSIAAWAAAALFAVNPLGSEAVLWAVGRAEILAAIFGLVAFVLFLRNDRERELGGGRLTLSVASFFAALCCKESAAAWLAIGAAWLALARRGVPARGSIVAGRAGAYVGALVLFAALRASAVGWARQPVPFVDNPLANADPATRVANAVLLFGRYVAKMVWPTTLSIDYGFDQIRIVPMVPWGALGALAIGALAALAIVILKKHGHENAAFLAAFIPAAFAVTGNLAFPIGTMFAERLAYLPLAGACGLAGVAVAAVPKPSGRAVVISILLAACSARIFVRCGDYADLATLSEATAAASPRAVKALANAGRVRMRQGHPELAQPLLERAVALWPDYARAWQLLAEAYAEGGDAVRAEEARRRAAAAASPADRSDDPL